MDKTAIIDLITERYNSFTGYMDHLTPEAYAFSYGDKWSAGQHLAHIVLCVKPLTQVFGMDKAAIEQSFGLSGRPGRTYEVLLSDYLEKLKEGGKAPARYVPGCSLQDRATMRDSLAKEIKNLCSGINRFTEQELDTLCIPHPLLGSLTMREMLYNAIYHVQHHQQAAVENLKHQYV